jgi:hypothetical protein
MSGKLNKDFHTPVKVLLFLFIAQVLFISCDERFEEINTNPNALTEIDPEYLFAKGTFETLRGGSNTMIQFPFGSQYAHIYVGRNNAMFIDRYYDYFEDSEYQSVFDNFYFGPIRLLEECMRLTMPGGEKENALRHAMARMMVMVNYARMADAFGSVPYLEGGKGQTGIIAPAYDPVELIYRTMLDQLANILEVLDGADPAGAFPGADPLYDNDLELWARFANSFRLRLAMRARFAAPELAEPIIRECLDFPLIEDNSQNAWYEHINSDKGELSNPIYGHFDFWQWGLSEFFVEHLKTRDDPRLEVFALPNVNGEFVGIPNGMEDAKLAEWGDWSEVSFPTDTLVGRAAPVYQMAAAEVWFLRAEAALFGITGEDANACYQAGLRSSLEQWTVRPEVTEAYMGGNAAATLNGSQEEQFEQISTQLWISFMSNEVEGWSNIRRTGYPRIARRMPPDFSVGVSNGILPHRLKYPVSETNINKENNMEAVEEQGPDEITTPLWWDLRD